MITEDEVKEAFRAVLGRQPENEGIVKGFQGYSNIAAFRRAVILSEESCTTNNIRVAGRNALSPPITVQTDGPADLISKLLEDNKKTWTDLGKSEAHWSVLSSDDFKSENMLGKEDAFYATGKLAADQILGYFKRSGHDIRNINSVVEFGCGVGRMTIALAEHFPKIIGVDISNNHIQFARQRVGSAGTKHISFQPISDIDDIEALPMCDLIVSFIVLQHNRPPVIRKVLEALLPRVNSGGYVLFQVPTYAENYNYEIDKPFENQNIEVHVLPQDVVFKILDQNNFEIIEVQEDDWVGIMSFRSNTFFCRKK